MKKVHIILFCVFAYMCVSCVSDAHAHEIKFMLGGSLSKYEIWPDTYFDSDRGDDYSYEISSKTGFLLGGGIEFTLSKYIYFEIDALYLQKGTEAQMFYSHLEIYVCPQNYTLHVISIPLLLKIKFLSGSSPYVLGGGEFSFILSHGYTSILDGLTGDSISIKEFTQSFNYGLVIGGGYEVKMEATSFFIEGRYYHGLRNIIKGSIDWETAKTRTIVFLAGFKI